MSDKADLETIEAVRLEELFALGMPGAFHERLEPLVGEWDVTMNIYAAPDAPPVRSTGMVSHKKWIMEKREVFEEIIAGIIAGMEHRKITILGFNNVNRRYEFTTIDNADTQTMTYHGTGDPNAAAITMTASYTQAALGNIVTGDGVGRANAEKERPTPQQSLVGISYAVRDVLTIENNNRHRLQMYFTPAAGHEVLAVEYIYTRQQPR